jgi:general transcription factor 3C polypeptide 5 (transcription factor C subunit 1)
MDIGPSHELPFDIQDIPMKVNWEDHVPKDSADWDQQVAVCKLFHERPVWPKQSLCERLIDDGVHVSQYQLRRLLPRAGYYFSSGPFAKFWIRRGYDPRRDSESRIFQGIDFRMPLKLRRLQMKRNSQKWCDLCNLEATPSKNSVFLQFFELKDEFVRAEIMQPSYLSACSASTGWFSMHIIEIIRLQVRIRYLSLCLYGVKNELRTAYELIERHKKREALCRSKQSKEDKDVGEEAPAIGTVTEDQADPDDSDSEGIGDEEDEGVTDEENEDEEDSDGDDSAHMAEDVDHFTLDDSFALGEGISCGYLEEVLGNFPIQGDDQNRPVDASNDADEASDGEFEIYEQPSDEEYSDG